MKRGYLLPPGCKDLIDVLNLKEKQQQALLTGLPHLPPLPKVFVTPWKPTSVSKPASLPPAKGEIIIPPETTVGELAALLDQKAFRIIGDLLEIGVFATVTEVIGFETISKVARKYGFTAKRAG